MGEFVGFYTSNRFPLYDHFPGETVDATRNDFRKAPKMAI